MNNGNVPGKNYCLMNYKNVRIEPKLHAPTILFMAIEVKVATIFRQYAPKVM